MLMTRAREKCIIFSNFRGRDLQLSSNSPFGLRALKVFLEYSENRNLKQIDKFPKSNETAFEEAILEFLCKQGYEVHEQVGCAGFRVDLAVVDPDYPERYLVGITCDGPIYQSSRVARDRDRLRQQILKGLGWNLYQLWSPDWYRNRAEVQKRLLKHIEELLDEERTELEFIPPVEDEYQVIQDSIKESEDEATPFEIDVGVLRSEITTAPSNAEKEKNEFHELEFDGVQENELNGEKTKLSTESTPSRVENSLDELIPYHLCNLNENFQTSEELHNQQVGDVARAVICVVQDEGPIHYDEVVKRIRTHWGLSRAGRRVQAIMKEAVELALQDGQIIRKGDFLYYKNAPIMVRRRTGKQKVNMDLISQEEIGEAVIMVLKSQYATLPDDLVREVVKLFGAKIARGPATRRINGVITQLINHEQMEKRPDGMVDLVRN